jgi:predicted nucleic-acid-binding protein
MNSQLYIVDTNFILRYLLADHPEQYKITYEFFAKVQNGTIKALIRETVLTEIVFVLSSHYKVPREKIVITLDNFLRYKGISITDKPVILRALEIYAQHSSLHIVDAIVSAYASFHNAQIMSFDADLIKRHNKAI